MSAKTYFDGPNIRALFADQMRAVWAWRPTSPSARSAQREAVRYMQGQLELLDLRMLTEHVDLATRFGDTAITSEHADLPGPGCYPRKDI